MSEPKREDYKTEVEYRSALQRYAWSTGDGIELPSTAIARRKGDGHTHEEER